MKRIRPFALLLVGLALLAQVPAALGQKHARKESPFEELRWNEEAPEVRVAGTWYRPVSIQGVGVDAILAFCEERWPADRERRFGEDLVEALVLMGHTPPAAVDLVLTRLEDGETVTLRGVVMSAENRRNIRDASREREHAPPEPIVLERSAALEDLDAFAAGLEDQFAYLEWRGVDLEAELAALRRELPEQVEGAWLADRLNRILLRFGDGHAGVSSANDAGSRSFPPVLLCQSAEGVVALRPDRSDFLDPERPYVATLDGEPLDVWLEALRPFLVDGSPQLVRERALRALRELESLRRHRELTARTTVRYGLVAGPDYDDVRELELDLVPRPPTYGSWPPRATGRIDDTIGYLRLERMSDRRIPELHAVMASFRDTEGLIVDVRGNGGGSRGLLLALAGYLLGPEEAPWVGSVAAYKQSARFGDDHLEARFMYRATDERWSPSQRAAIERLAKSFEPEWRLPAGFSEWHYLVLDRTGHASEFFYDRPVIVLADASCFSATDIFLGALSGRPRVTLMGTASGGGSARSQSFALPRSGIRVQCASMASFRPDGRLYDGRGVEVDVHVPAAPTDFLADGTDRCLEAAIERLRDG